MYFGVASLEEEVSVNCYEDMGHNNIIFGIINNDILDKEIRRRTTHYAAYFCFPYSDVGFSDISSPRWKKLYE